MTSVTPVARWFGGLTTDAKGWWLASFAAFWAAAFLIPYKQASANGEAPVVAFGLLLAAAVESSVLRLARIIPRDVSATPGRTTQTVEWASAVALAGLAVAGNTCSAKALVELGPATVSVVMRTEVLIVGCLGWLLLGERPDRGFWLGAVLALTGLCVLGGIDAALGARPSVVFGLLGALCFSLMQLLARRVAGYVDLARVNTRRLWLSACSFVFWPGVLERVPLTGQFWLWVACAAACGPVLSRLLLMHSVRYVAASQTSLVMLSAPVFALGLGFLVLGSLPSLREILGGGLMLVGIAAALFRR